LLASEQQLYNIACPILAFVRTKHLPLKLTL